MGAAKIIAELSLGDERTGAAVAAEMAPLLAPQLAANKIANLLMAMAAGMARGRLRIRVDDATPVAAARTLACTGANIAAGEYIEFVTPIGRFRVTCVASGAVDGDKTFNASGTDNTVATNIRQAINTHPQLKDWVVASGATNNVIVTALRKGGQGNAINIVDGTVNGLSPAGGLLTGGKDPAARVTATAALVFANIAADDTITIAGVVFTWKASAGAESEVTIGADATAAGANLAAKINAHSKLLGIVTATSASGTVTITYLCDPRIAVLLLLATSDGNSATLTQPATTLTLANSFATRDYDLGEGTA